MIGADDTAVAVKLTKYLSRQSMGCFNFCKWGIFVSSDVNFCTFHELS
jgi:hypothetical protein